MPEGKNVPTPTATAPVPSAFAGYSWFWVVWVVGFAVVLPLVSIAFGLDDEEPDGEESAE